MVMDYTCQYLMTGGTSRSNLAVDRSS